MAMQQFTPEQQQANKEFQKGFWKGFKEYAPFIPNYKSDNTDIKPVTESQVQTNQSVAQPEAKPATPTSTSNLASLDTAPTFKPVEAKAIDTPALVPKTNYLIPNQPLPDGVNKSLNAKGNVVYSDNANSATANAAQNQVVNATAQPTQPRLTQDQVRQLYRELPADSISAAGMGGTTPQERYANQGYLTLPKQQDPNAYRNSLIAQANTFGHFGDAAKRRNALAQLGLLDSREQNTENNQARQKIADSENAMKQAYYDSENLLNQARAQAALRPSQPKPDIHWNEDNTASYIDENGNMRKVQQAPDEAYRDKYNQKYDEALAMPESEEREKTLNALDNDATAKKLGITRNR